MPHRSSLLCWLTFLGWSSLLVAGELELPKTQAKLKANQPVKIVCMGDSVTGIYYHTGGLRAYPEMLAIGLKTVAPDSQVTVINAGFSGHATNSGVGRLERDVDAHRPDLVTVMFGLNDVTRIPKADYQANLKTIIDRCRAVGAEVLLCTPNGVIDTVPRPITKLEEYNQAMKEVGEQAKVPVCDVYAAYQAVRKASPLEFRLLCSDEIHPNMDGHKLNAEVICEAITGKRPSLKNVPPPTPGLAKVRQKLADKQPVRIRAMTPYDQWIGPAILDRFPEAKLEVSPWETQGQSLKQLHAASEGIRKLDPKPDLVIVAIPLAVTPQLSQPKEADIAHHSWILNFSLSFGLQEWDVLAVSPSVVSETLTPEDAARDAFSLRMIQAQDLHAVTRPQESAEAPVTILTKFLAEHLR